MENPGLFAGVASLFTFLGVAANKLYDWAVARYKRSADDRKADEDQFDKTTELQRGIIADLRSDINRLMSLLKDLEKERLDCRVENATLKSEVKILQSRIAALEGKLS